MAGGARVGAMGRVIARSRLYVCNYICHRTAALFPVARPPLRSCSSQLGFQGFRRLLIFKKYTYAGSLRRFETKTIKASGNVVVIVPSCGHCTT